MVPQDLLQVMWVHQDAITAVVDHGCLYLILGAEELDQLPLLVL